jgi:hypothetical protein
LIYYWLLVYDVVVLALIVYICSWIYCRNRRLRWGVEFLLAPERQLSWDVLQRVKAVHQYMHSRKPWQYRWLLRRLPPSLLLWNVMLAPYIRPEAVVALHCW